MAMPMAEVPSIKSNQNFKKLLQSHLKELLHCEVYTKLVIPDFLAIITL